MVRAVAIDDSQLSTMPILLPRAECDFLAVLLRGGWPMSSKLWWVNVGAEISGEERNRVYVSDG